MSCFRFIATVEVDHPVALSCHVVGVSRSGYYAWRARQPELLHRIRQIHERSRGTYGSSRIHAELIDPNGTHRLRCAQAGGAADAPGRTGGVPPPWPAPPNDDAGPAGHARARSRRAGVRARADRRPQQTVGGGHYLMGVPGVAR